MKFRLTSAVALASLAVAFGSTAFGQTADLKITFLYDGAAPAPAAIAMGKDAWCAGAHPNPVLEEKLIVNASNKGIKNVVILPDAKKSNLEEKDVPAEAMAKAKAPVVLDNVKCVFQPHIFTTVPGGKVTVKNSDETGHNANFNFFENPAKNQIIPSGGSVDFAIDKPERAPIPVDCNVHPWMKSYVIVSETPFVGISNENGELVIEKLPANKKILLKVWHENSEGAIAKVNLDGKDVEWKKGAIELTLKPGVNDLGVCKLTPAHFKK